MKVHCLLSWELKSSLRLKLMPISQCHFFSICCYGYKQNIKTKYKAGNKVSQKNGSLFFIVVFISNLWTKYCTLFFISLLSVPKLSDLCLLEVLVTCIFSVIYIHLLFSSSFVIGKYRKAKPRK